LEKLDPITKNVVSRILKYHKKFLTAKYDLVESLIKRAIY